MQGNQTLTYVYRWNDAEDTVEELAISDPNTNQTVRATHEGNGQYTYTSLLIGDDGPMATPKTFTLEQVTYYALVNLGVLPPNNLETR